MSAKNFHPRDFYHPSATTLRLITDWIDVRYDPFVGGEKDSYDAERYGSGGRRPVAVTRQRGLLSPESQRDIERTREERRRRAHLKSARQTSNLKDD